MNRVCAAILLMASLAFLPHFAKGASGWDPRHAVHSVTNTKSKLVHPGIGMNGEDLIRLATFVSEGVEPWASYYRDLTKHDHRFSKKPRIFTQRNENPTAIDSPDFDNRCQWDSQTAFCQAVMYVITGEESYREWALEVVRWFPEHITSARPHWDSQFRWPYAENWYLKACEILRYTGPTEGPLAWTEADTEAVNRFISLGENMWWGRGSYLNQLQWTLGGPIGRAIWRDDRAMYDEMVEILTSNKQGPEGECNGSIREMCRLVSVNEVTGEPVKPHVQYTEMGRDIGHAFPGAGALAENLTVIRSQGTRVDPVTGEVSTKKDAVDPLEFLGHRLLRGINQICKYNLGFDIDWTPMYINRKKGEIWERPANWGGGRGRIVDSMDVVYLHYRWARRKGMSRSEESRYFDYANKLRGVNLFTAFFWMPKEAAGVWKDERIDPGRDKTNHFAEFIQPKEEGLEVKTDKVTGAAYVAITKKGAIFPLFLHRRRPLTEPGEYTLRYRARGESAIGVINPEDYATEFSDGVAKQHRLYVEKVRLPSTGGEWKTHTFRLEKPPKRNLIKLDFRTKAPELDIEWLKVP